MVFETMFSIMVPVILGLIRSALAQRGGFSGVDDFATDVTQATWVAPFTMFIAWLLGLLLTPLLSRFGTKRAPSSAARQEAGATGATSGGMDDASLTMGSRIGNFTRAGRDAFLILLGTTVINQAGHGFGGAVVALTWVMFAILSLWAIMQLFRLPYWLDFLGFLPAAVLAVILFSLAFRNAGKRSDVVVKVP
ncbi:hypothetical protein BJ742DRAFT_826540 [Cladochytrium replicatum]|nr:hypothetical protein BJ742DRAFT_826540 [Cladochytrium replicatum]